MKQSKRLVSVLLAVIMLFSVFSVGVNAALVQNEVNYDSIDNAVLSPEQVADIILDLLEPVLADVDLDIGAVGLVIKSVDTTLETVEGIGTLANVAGGDVANIEPNAVKGVRRSGGDLNVIYALLQFLADNTNANLHLEKVAYGIGQDKSDAADAKLAVGKLLWTGKIIGIDLGFNLKDMEFIGQLGDIPGLLKGLIFDLLLQGSYAYPNEWETETNASIKSMSLEDMINNAIYNLLTTPQEYTRDENGNKIWDNDSVILGKIGTEGYSLQKSDLTVAGAGAKTILGLVDTILQEAYNEFATVVLNHDVKKIIMEATGADFIRITDEAEIARVSTQTGMPTTGVKNYFCNAAMWKDAASGIYYFRDYVTETTVDEATGEEIKNKVDRYFVANAANANKFFDLVNWDYLFTESTYNFDAGLAQYGSIFGQLNHLVYAILDEAILDSIKADIAAVTGKAWWTDGDNTNLIPNLINVAKWVLQYAPEEIFSKDSEFYDLEYSEIAGMNTLKELLAFIGIPLLQDGMPQLILPDNLEAANIIEQIGAIVLREFISDVTPVVNYDAQIFQAGTLDAAQRKIITGQDSEYWFNIVLNMAIDMAVIYLDNITNINLDSAKVAEYKAAGWGWEQFLDEIVDWAILYVGSGANCPLAGLDPNTLGAVRGDGAAQGLNKLTKALNTILPLGLVSNCSGSNAGTEYPLDMQVLFNKLKSLLHNVDLNELLSLFGRQNQTGNLLLSAPLDTTVVHLVIDILNLLLGAGRIAKVDTLTALTSKANLKLLVGSLIHGLNTRKVAILTPVLPIVAAFVEGWGTEQNFEAPDINICPKFVAGQNGECSIRNNINGVWRKYAGGQDNQYSLVVDSITTNNGAVTVVERDGAYTGTYTLSENQPFRLNSSLTADTMVQVTVTYHINAEDGIKLGGKNFTATRDVYVTNGNEGKKADYTNSTAAKKQIGTTSRSNIAFIDISGDAVGSIANAVETTTADFNRYNLWLLNDNNKGDVSITFTYSLGSLATLGIGAANPSVTLGRGDESNGHVVFTSTGVTADKLVPGRYEGSYSVGLPYTTTKQSGNFATGTAYLVIYLYDSKAFVELQDTVGDVRNAARIASDYYTDDMVINYTDAAGVEHEDVTVNGAAAWANYDAAYKAAYNVAYQDWDTSSVFSGYEAYEDALRDAATILDCFKKSAEDLGGDNVDAAVDALKAAKEQAEESLNSYKDYMLYRWDRYTEYANRANDVINKKDAASKTADIYSIPGTGYSYYDVNKLLTDANSPYKSFVLATREDLTAEQIKANQTNLKNAKNAYANVTSVQVADIANNVSNMAARLIVREGNENGAVKTYLQHEVNSAIAALGEAETSATYSPRSWARYTEALANAKAILADADAANNSTIFDAKYALQYARNELILYADDADYTEIDNAIAMAEAALTMTNLYVAIDGSDPADEWGNVVKALGLTVKNADNNDVTIFGGAKEQAAQVYAINRQGRLDSAADALMAALSKLKFATASVTPLPAAPVQKEEDQHIIVDEDNTEITVNLLMIAPISTAAIVRDQVTVNLPGNASDGDISTTAAFMGTGAVVTVTGVIDGNRVPLNAYTVIVKGDINGDSAVDAIDAASVELALHNFATLYGVQNIAARYTGGATITVNDFAAIENAAIA